MRASNLVGFHMCAACGEPIKREYRYCRLCTDALAHRRDMERAKETNLEKTKPRFTRETQNV